MKGLIQRFAFAVRYRWIATLRSSFRKGYYSILGMQLGKGTFLSKVQVTWPHKVSIGNNCLIEHQAYFKFDGLWQPDFSILIGHNVFIGSSVEFNITKRITIGNDCLIASGCRFIDHDHGYELPQPMRTQDCKEADIQIGDNVWLACNVIVLKGVRIGNGAIIGAGAVVNKSVGENEIWVGVPAKKIGSRF